jgi:uncharacterized protein YqeY
LFFIGNSCLDTQNTQSFIELQRGEEMLEDKILADFKDAMKNNDVVKKTTLSFLRAEFKNVSIDKKKNKLEDVDVIAVIKRQIQQRQDSIEKFKSGNRLDLAEKEQKELEILKAYLPKEMPKEELDKIIDEVISSSGATSIKDMGKVMKEVITKVSGKADNKMLSDLVKTKLSKNESSNPAS